MYPGIASLAAQIEMFGLSKREIEEKFTRSETILLAWRSMEISAGFEKQAKDMRGGLPPTNPRKHTDGRLPENLPAHFYNEEGEIDLRKVTGEEAYKFMMSQGIKLPVIRR